MGNPYFSVGEEVIVVSEDRPQFNGDHIVDKIFNKGRQPHPFVANATLNVIRRYGYSLVGINPEVLGESALRKKPKLSDDSISAVKSWSELKDNINDLEVTDANQPHTTV